MLYVLVHFELTHPLILSRDADLKQAVAMLAVIVLLFSGFPPTDCSDKFTEEAEDYNST